MVLFSLLSITSRAYGGGTAVVQGIPFGPAAGGMPRSLGTAAAWAICPARAVAERRHQPPLLLSCYRPKNAAISGGGFSHPRRPTHTARNGRRRAFFSTSNPARSAAGEEVTFVTTDAAARRNADPGSVAFVTGANRGIGLEVTRQLLAKTNGTIVAACRNPSGATDLQSLAKIPGNENRLDVVRMDLENQASLEAAAHHVKSKYGRVDLLFNVAGVLGDGKSTPGPERSLRAMDREWLRHTLEVNTIGPMMLVAALAPLLESPSKRGDDGARPPSVVVNFSARVGSIGDNHMGGWHSYRMSKSALNMATKGISLELRRRRVWAFSYHPGTTDTGLSEPFQANVKPEKLFTPEYTVSQMLGIVDSMTEKLSGGFFAFDGSRIEF